MPPELLLGVLRHIGPGERNRWARRKDVLTVIGRLEEGAELSAREMERRGLYSRGWACRVLRELAELEVLIARWSSAGPRAAGWVVNPDVLEWREVPWLIDPRIVRDEVNHPVLSAAPEFRPVSRLHRVYRDAVRSGVAVLPPKPRHKDHLASRFSGESATQGSPSVAVNRGSARHWTGGGYSSSSAVVGGDPLAAGYGGSPAAGDSSLDEARIRLRAMAKKKLGVAFFEGRALAHLVELVSRYGDDPVLDALEHYAEAKGSRSKRDALRIMDLVDEVTTAVVLAGDERLERTAPIEASEPDRPAPPARGAALPPTYQRSEPAADDAEPLPIEAVRELIRQARTGPASDPAAAVG